MSNEEEIKQKRRQKILARINNESEGSQDNTEQQIETSTEPLRTSVFDRYRLLKLKQQNQKLLTWISKTVGFFIVLLSYYLPSETVFWTVLIAFIVSSLYITRQIADSQANELAWLVKWVPLASKLKNIERIIFTSVIGLNVLLSYLVCAVLINSLQINIQKLGLGQL